MDADSQTINKKETLAGCFTLIRFAIEAAVLMGMTRVGQSISMQWGDIGNASAGDLGWLMGLFLGAFSIYLIEAPTIGTNWPQPTSLERKPEPLSITIWVIAFCTVIAVSSCYGLVLFGWPGAWLGGFAGFFLLALLSRIKRFLKRLSSVDPQ